MKFLDKKYEINRFKCQILIFKENDVGEINNYIVVHYIDFGLQHMRPTLCP